MANRFVLNETLINAAGAIKVLLQRQREEDFKRAFVCSDPDLLNFGVTKKVIDVLEGAVLL